VGIPTFLGLILYSNHKKLVLQTPRCQKRYGFLYAKYEDRAWYWELVEMFRKLLFTSLIMFLAQAISPPHLPQISPRSPPYLLFTSLIMLLAQGTATQIVVAMFISFCWLIGHLIIQAYKETVTLTLTLTLPLTLPLALTRRTRRRRTPGCRLARCSASSSRSGSV